MRLGQWLGEAEGLLRGEGVPYPRRDALLLAGCATGFEKAILLAHPEMPLDEAKLSVLEGLVARRRRREPMQYIRGFQEFWGLPIAVGPGCLIPRPETEHLVEEALARMPPGRSPRAAELGTGSGCVLAALAASRPDGLFLGMERDAGALAWSAKNLAGRTRVLLIRGDFSSPPPARGLDAVLCNPPYITDAQWPGLLPEVRLFEPEGALRCGADALGPYRAAARWAAEALGPGGFLLCELGTAQARLARHLRGLHPGFRWEAGVRDYAGRLRVAIWTKRECA